jgi:hypothetical protein
VFFGIFLAILIRYAIPPIIIPALCFIGVTVILIALLIGGMRYIIFEDTLYMKIWMIPYWTVKIANIKSIERSYNLLLPKFSGSFKGIRIIYLGKVSFCSILITPAKEQEFIEHLKKINPKINTHVPVKKGIWRIQDWDI